MGVILEETIYNDMTDSMERNKKQQEYYDYIVDHIANVHKAYELYFIPLLSRKHISDIISDEEFRDAIISAKEDIDKHDASKFGEDEFDPYRERFYPTREEQINDDNDYETFIHDRFEQAWIHHYTNNNHHPMYWVNKETGEIRDMTLRAIVHMICDWEAMSMAMGTNTIDWFQNKADKEKEAMSPNTLKLVNEILLHIIHS
jgi:anaerobic selenocysteine-containing dehydrogenase